MSSSRLPLALLALLLAGGARAQTYLVAPGATWTYFKATQPASTPSDAWAQPTFDDSTWLSGAMPLGYGYANPALATVLTDMQGNYASVDCRASFQVPDPTTVIGLQLDIEYDDGFVAYLNGVEVARRGLRAGATSNTQLAVDHTGDVMETIPLSDCEQLLVAGTNVLAIEIHNSALFTSNDLLLDPALEVVTQDPTARGPYLQELTDQSVLVRWTTRVPSGSTVEYGAYQSPFPASFPQSVTDPTPTTDHRMVLPGLATYSHFMYRVAGDGELRSPDLTFWSLVRTGDHVYDFAVVGSTGSGESQSYEIGRRMREHRPDFTLHVGDVVHPAGQAEYYDGDFFQPFKALMGGSAVFPAVGEEDVATASGQGWLDAFTTWANGPSADARDYSMDIGDAHFLVLDSTRPAADFAAGVPLGDWVRADLAAAATRCWRVVVLHNPLYTSNAMYNQSPSVDLRPVLAPVFQDAHVDLVFSGHEKAYERSFPIVNGSPQDTGQEPAYTSPPGPIYVVTGGGGERPLDPLPGFQRSFTATMHSSTNFVFVQVTSGQFHVQAWDQANVTTPFDDFTITKVCPTDSDGDTIPDASDNCPFVPNPSQSNMDGDSLGDACDPDADGDGVNAPADCNDLDPTVRAIPAEETPLLVRKGVAAGSVALAWTGPTGGTGSATQVIEGGLADLWQDRGFGRAACAQPAGVPGSTFTYAPVTGNRYFLVRGKNSCGHGTWGSSGHTPDPRAALDTPGTTPCP